MRPVFLNLEATLRIHARVISQDGGDANLRDLGLLESAVAQPQAMFGGEYLHRDIAEMAAAYLFHLAMNHAFVDGNKRVATACMWVFLELNELTLEVSDIELETLVLGVAKGELSKAQVADFIRPRLEPLNQS